SEGMGTEVAQAHFAVGRPWTLPMREKFVNSYAEYYPFMIMGDTDEYLKSNWGFVDPSKAGDRYANATGMALVGEGYEAGAKGMFGFPKFTTSNLERVSIAFDIYLGSITPEVDVYAEGPLGMAREKIGTLTADRTAEAWKRVEFPLPTKFCNLGWVQIILDAHFATDEQKVLIDSYSFKPDVAYDLGVVSITGPNTPEISRENHYTAQVDNIGTRADAIPTGIWRVTSDGREIASAIVPASHDILEPDALCAYQFSFTPTADHIGTATVSFEIGLTDDDTSNNKASKSINIAQGSTVAVTDLVASCVDGNVRLEWSEPKLDDGVESFEECEPFLLNDDAAWLGNFRNIDLDGQITYGTSGWTNPNSGVPGAFSVWDLDEIDRMLAEAGFKEHTYSAAEGRRLAIAFSTGAGYSTDDWLISPQVVGGTDVSFKLRAISTAYPETVEVLYSTSGDSPADFEGNRLTRYTTRDDYAMGDDIKYETITLTLPADARYFAIRYVSRDMFAVMIDDIHYSPAQSAEGVTAYDIVRDSRTIVSAVNAPDCRFIDTSVEPKHTYAYQVVPVLGVLGRGALSNTAWTGVSGIEDVTDAVNGSVIVNGHHIIATGFEGRSLSLATVDGRTIAVRRAAGRSESFAVAPGVYILSTGNSSYKLIVK
ncbi:MAG: choice-of-anchor J domain-containing protein, partial [Muribaculaceae bacterium]|nr:choice-of-anchor J domain-containing protein [Muribaculaceae bacterium]